MAASGSSEETKSLGEGRYLLKSIHNGFLGANFGGRVVCRHGTPGPSEAWTLRAFPGGGGCGAKTLSSVHGRYLCASGWWWWSVVCNRDAARSWEQWRARVTADGFVTFESFHGTFLATDASGAVFQAPALDSRTLQTHWVALPCPADVARAAHTWEALGFSRPVWCDFCGSMIWGLGTQGHRCSTCGLTVHRICANLVGNTCNSGDVLFRPGQQQQQQQTPEEKAAARERRKTMALAVCTGPQMDEAAALAQSVAREEEWLLQRRSTAKARILVDGDLCAPQAIIEDYATLPRATPPQDFETLLFGGDAAPAPAPAPAPATAPATVSPKVRPKSVAQPLQSEKERRKAQLEAVLRRGPMGAPPGARATMKPTTATAVTAAMAPRPAPAPRQAPAVKVEHVGALGMPVSKAPRLDHFERARGPKGRRRPTAL